MYIKISDGILEDEIKRVTLKIFNESQNNLIKENHVDTGELLTSGSFKITKDEGLIIYDAPHSEDVEYGSDPHYVPLEDLQKWARRKLNLKKKTADKVGYFVQQKIAKNGTEPTRFIRNAVDSVVL